jgi:hypothetical protein
LTGGKRPDLRTVPQLGRNGCRHRDSRKHNTWQARMNRAKVMEAIDTEPSKLRSKERIVFLRKSLRWIAIFDMPLSQRPLHLPLCIRRGYHKAQPALVYSYLSGVWFDHRLSRGEISAEDQGYGGSVALNAPTGQSRNLYGGVPIAPPHSTPRPSTTSKF